jgi:hypothetical protein
MNTDELLNTLQGDEYTEKVRFEAKRLKDKLDFCIKHDTPTGNLFERINKLKEYVNRDMLNR